MNSIIRTSAIATIAVAAAAVAVPASASSVPACPVGHAPAHWSLVRAGNHAGIGAAGVLQLTSSCGDFSPALRRYVDAGNLRAPLPSGVRLVFRPAM